MAGTGDNKAVDGFLGAGCLVWLLSPLVILAVAWIAGKKPADLGHEDSNIIIIGFVVAAVIAAVVIGNAASRTRIEAEKKKAEAERQQRRQEEEERRWNSPEAIEQRRLAAERLRVEAQVNKRIRELEEERRAREKWDRYHRCMRIEEVDEMTGVQFERFAGTLFERLGHKNVTGTPGSGDQGADLVCESPDNKRAVVQTKRWKGPVGNSAIQEVLGALVFYDAELAFVITSSYFTDSAKTLAEKHGRIHLVDRTELVRMITAAFPREVPPFDWDEYRKHVVNWLG